MRARHLVALGALALLTLPASASAAPPAPSRPRLRPDRPRPAVPRRLRRGAGPELRWRPARRGRRPRAHRRRSVPDDRHAPRVRRLDGRPRGRPPAARRPWRGPPALARGGDAAAERDEYRCARAAQSRSRCSAATRRRTRRSNRRSAVMLSRSGSCCRYGSACALSRVVVRPVAWRRSPRARGTDSCATAAKIGPPVRTRSEDARGRGRPWPKPSSAAAL